ncbi:hypothetical protein B7C51_25155 (plasmid) [Paenibacillus larvae subsp. pulvifaciens]|uniref:Uncharacterized protein n=1 Tax=Paenibacillus larvae subsp. pulvifaciens TaxID=1477 RepID=A0A1V0UZV4_9BACL|nr:hypothetical protein [Paenibacillus larvae]ARF70762.1 hypothetical protein B7C51_25155 [Paenibacillus larvae subsp. pulvifaciens]
MNDCKICKISSLTHFDAKDSVTKTFKCLKESKNSELQILDALFELYSKGYRDGIIQNIENRISEDKETLRYLMG